MSGLLRGELAKTLSTRTLPAFALGCAALAALNAVIVAALSGTLDDVEEKREALSCLPVLALVWGLVGTAGEHRHGTAAPAALVARRGRGPLLAARLAAYGVTGLGLGLVSVAVVLAVGLPLLARQPGPALDGATLRAAAGGTLAAFTLYALLGAAIGALVRNQVVGVVVVLVAEFAVVPLIGGADEGLGNLTPAGAASVLSGMTHDTTIGAAAAGLVLAAWTAAALLAAVAGERGRDLA